jgi:hypothetical protein
LPTHGTLSDSDIDFVCERLAVALASTGAAVV